MAAKKTVTVTSKSTPDELIDFLLEKILDAIAVPGREVYSEEWATPKKTAKGRTVAPRTKLRIYRDTPNYKALTELRQVIALKVALSSGTVDDIETLQEELFNKAVARQKAANKKAGGRVVAV